MLVHCILIPALLLASLGSRFSYCVSVCVFVWVSTCRSLPKPEVLDLLELEIELPNLGVRNQVQVLYKNSILFKIS